MLKLLTLYLKVMRATRDEDILDQLPHITIGYCVGVSILFFKTEFDKDLKLAIQVWIV